MTKEHETNVDKITKIYRIENEIRMALRDGSSYLVFPEGSTVSAENEEPHEDLGEFAFLQVVAISLISAPENHRELDENEALLGNGVCTGIMLHQWRDLRKELVE